MPTLVVPCDSTETKVNARDDLRITASDDKAASVCDEVVVGGGWHRHYPVPQQKSLVAEGKAV